MRVALEACSLIKANIKTAQKELESLKYILHGVITVRDLFLGQLRALSKTLFEPGSLDKIDLLRPLQHLARELLLERSVFCMERRRRISNWEAPHYPEQIQMLTHLDAVRLAFTGERLALLQGDRCAESRVVAEARLGSLAHDRTSVIIGLPRLVERAFLAQLIRGGNLIESPAGIEMAHDLAIVRKVQRHVRAFLAVRGVLRTILDSFGSELAHKMNTNSRTNSRSACEDGRPQTAPVAASSSAPMGATSKTASKKKQRNAKKNQKKKGNK
jgi:hypothetical protein